MFIAWRKLRRRDLGPVLNANGWAINSKALVNIAFGATLTSLAKYPKLTAVDAQERKRVRRRRILCWCCGILLLCGIGAALYFTDRLTCIGLPYHKEVPEEVAGVEAVPEEAAAEAVAAEEAPAAAETPAAE